jgi:hypothetical protein
MRSCDLSLDNQNGHGEETNTEALDGATGNEARKSRSEDLYECAQKIDDATEADSSLSSNDVAESSRNQRTNSC